MIRLRHTACFCISIFFGCSLLLFTQSADNLLRWFEQKSVHTLQNLSEHELKILSDKSQHNITFESLLDPMLIPRVVGTENHATVRKYISDIMTELNWTVELDEFEDMTPFGKKTFSNIITTVNPQSSRHLVLACHYDSKYSREGTFVGATDSAVPCAMMIYIAVLLDEELKAHCKTDPEVSLQFIFFDGEEAFRTWGPKDSIYGARNLARKWEQSPYPQKNRDGTNRLHRMDVLVLLDLLGVQNPTFYSFFPQTEEYYDALVNIEDQLRKLKLLFKQRGRYFQPKSTFAGVEDDHIPFLERDVSILHIIPHPFPAVWHTFGDNKAALHFQTISDLNKIFRIFVARYLKLEVI